MASRAKRARPGADYRGRVAGPLVYAALVVLLAKLARVAEITFRTESWAPVPVALACFGEDLILVAVVGLLAHAAVRTPRRIGMAALILLVLAPIAALLPADVVAHKLTGAPLTWQRLRGDEGATLADLDLLAGTDLWGGLGGIALALLLIWPCLRLAGRLSWARSWARRRALFVTLVVGAGMSLAQQAFLPRSHGLSDQPVFVMAASFSQPPNLDALALSDPEWAALHRPGIELPRFPTPRREGKVDSVVIFLAEGIPFKHTGFARKRADPDPTPNLTRRFLRHGMVFDRYRANWHASIQAIFSVVCSAFPPMRGDIVRIKPRIDCGELSEVMREQGVRAGLFHGGRFNFYNKLALLGRRGYEVELDADELAHTSKRRTHQWGIDDRAVVDATLSWIDTLPKEAPFAALLIPITAHYPYWIPRGQKRVYGAKGREGRFLEAVRFQDQVVEDLMQGLEKRGRYERTLIVWLGDHGHSVSEPPRLTPGVRGFYEPNLHTPLVLINPRMFPPQLKLGERISHRTGSHPDLLPTIIDAMGHAPDPRWQGQSLLSERYRDRRVFFAAANGKYVGFVEGDLKFVYDTHRRRAEYYDLAADPDELRDLSHEHGERMERYGEDAIQFARAVRGRIDAAKVLPETVSISNVYDLFLEHVEVRHRSGDTWTECPRDEKGRPSCPGLGPRLKERRGKFMGELRRCVMVRLPPPEDELELIVKHPETLELLSGTMVALTRNVKGAPGVKVAVATDGQSHRGEWLTFRGAARPRHPRAKREIRFSFQRGEKSEVDQVCLQLTTLEH